ncbi:hypothetical protein ACFLWV_02595 [Chloroflexota bacterium]
MMQGKEDRPSDKALALIVAGTAFVLPSMGWLFFAGLGQTMEFYRLFMYIEVWLPLVVLFVAAGVLGLGVTSYRRLIYIIGAGVFYCMSLVALALWLLVFNPPGSWQW